MAATCRTDKWLMKNDPTFMKTFGPKEDYMDLDELARVNIEGVNGCDFEAAGYAYGTPVDRAIRNNGNSVFVTEP